MAAIENFPQPLSNLDVARRDEYAMLQWWRLRNMQRAPKELEIKLEKRIQNARKAKE